MNADSILVVDASVAVKWIVPELDRTRALLLIDPARQLIAPDFILIESANTFVKKLRRGELDRESARDGSDEIERIVELRPVGALLLAAFDLALQYGRSVYDALYVALAIDEGCRFVTADERLYNALQPHMPDTMLWLRDVPAS